MIQKHCLTLYFVKTEHKIRLRPFMGIMGMLFNEMAKYLAPHSNVQWILSIAVEGMLDWLQELYSFERKEALNVASLLVDLRITQLVNEVAGEHAAFSKDNYRSIRHV